MTTSRWKMGYEHTECKKGKCKQQPANHSVDEERVALRTVVMTPHSLQIVTLIETAGA